jgi:hypothetical protein
MITDNAQHRAFIEVYLRTGDKRAAYKTAYPEIKDGDSLRVSSNRLYRQLQPQIDALESKAREIAINEMMQEAAGRIKKEICTMQQRREVLAELILGQRKQKRHIRLCDTIVEVEDDVSPYSIIRAIDLDSRLAANKYKEKGIEYKQEAAKPVIDSIGVRQDIYLPHTDMMEQNLKKYPYGHQYWKGHRIKMHGKEIEKFGFDLLDEGIPYLNGELTEAFKQQRLEKDIEYFKEHFPKEAKELFDNKPPEIAPAEKAETKRNNTETEQGTTEPTAKDLWDEYLKLDSNTRALHPTDRKQKETWFRHIPEKQQIKLIEFYKKAG